MTVDLEDGPAAVADDTLREKLRETISNTRLSERFLALARDLDVMEPRAPDDVRSLRRAKLCRAVPCRTVLYWLEPMLCRAVLLTCCGACMERDCRAHAGCCVLES